MSNLTSAGDDRAVGGRLVDGSEVRSTTPSLRGSDGSRDRCPARRGEPILCRKRCRWDTAHLIRNTGARVPEMYARSTTTTVSRRLVDAYVGDEVTPTTLAMGGCVDLPMIAGRDSGHCTSGPSIDLGLAPAIGTGLASPGRIAVADVGDGGFMMSHVSGTPPCGGPPLQSRGHPGTPVEIPDIDIAAIATAAGS